MGGAGNTRATTVWLFLFALHRATVCGSGVSVAPPPNPARLSSREGAAGCGSSVAVVGPLRPVLPPKVLFDQVAREAVATAPVLLRVAVHKDVRLRRLARRRRVDDPPAASDHLRSPRRGTARGADIEGALCERGQPRQPRCWPARPQAERRFGDANADRDAPFRCLGQPRARFPGPYREPGRRAAGRFSGPCRAPRATGFQIAHRARVALA